MNNIISIKVLPLIVIYGTKIEDAPSYKTLKLNFAEHKIFIYDNSAKSQPAPSGTVYVHDPSNPGVSHAYNAVANYAYENDFDFILLSDQDTEFQKDYLEIFYEAYNRYPNHKIFFPKLYSENKLISPAKFKYCRATYAEEPSGNIIDLSSLMPINSGMIIDINHYFANNGYRDEVFLDFSDFDFIERGLKLCKEGVLLDCQCKHELNNLYTSTRESALLRLKKQKQSMLNYARGSAMKTMLVWFWCFLRRIKRNTGILAC